MAPKGLRVRAGVILCALGLSAASPGLAETPAEHLAAFFELAEGVSLDAEAFAALLVDERGFAPDRVRVETGSEALLDPGDWIVSVSQADFGGAKVVYISCTRVGHQTLMSIMAGLPEFAVSRSGQLAKDLRVDLVRTPDLKVDESSVRLPDDAIAAMTCNFRALVGRFDEADDAALDAMLKERFTERGEVPQMITGVFGPQVWAAYEREPGAIYLDSVRVGHRNETREGTPEQHSLSFWFVAIERAGTS